VIDIGDVIGLLSDKPPTSKAPTTAKQFYKSIEGFLDHLGDVESRRPALDKLRSSALHEVCGRREAIFAVHPELDRPGVVNAGRRLTFDVGHNVHATFQNKYLGPMGVLWGQWICRSCRKIIIGVMPTKCESCGAGRRAPVLWTDDYGNECSEVLDNIEYVEFFFTNEEHGYTGHPDGLLLDGDMSLVMPNALFELKTISPSGYKSLKEAKPDHVIQMHAYMNQYEMHEALIVYFDKGKQCEWTRTDGPLIAGKMRLKIFHVEWDDNVWNHVVERMDDHWKARALLAREEPAEVADVVKFPRVCDSPTCFLAKECPARDQCFSLRTP
jgi:hypothetical protein